MVVNFRSYSSGCAVETTCGVTVTDVTLAQGQGFHGSFGRGETFNFMAAIGPDFRAGFVDPMPVGNTDVAPTIARILGLTLPSRGALQGRVMEEALKDGRTSMVRSHIRRSAPGLAGLRTSVEYQEAGGTLYFDAGGFPGRTLGLRSER